MNILSIIERIGGIDFGNVSSQSSSKSKSAAGFVKVAAGVGALSAMPKISTAKTASTVIDVLNFALTLEFLESSYYTQGVASGVIPASDMAIFNQIKKHENDHVTLLQNTIAALGGSAVTSPTFDFTANGAFNPFSVYEEFLVLAQGFEDTGVRAYKGQAANLISNNAVLTAALSIHSVEARHASEVRRLRKKNGFDPNNKGWITGNSRGTMPAVTQGIYDGAISESNIMQGGVDLTTITTFGVGAITEAFDEPLTDAETLAIATLFIV